MISKHVIRKGQGGGVTVSVAGYLVAFYIYVVSKVLLVLQSLFLFTAHQRKPTLA